MLGFRGKLKVCFSGGGKPTFDWDTFVCAVEKAKSLVLEYRYKVKFGILKNGIGYTDKKIQFIATNFSFVQISINGTKEIQNIHRPAFNGSDSFGPVDTFIKCLMATGVHFGLRSTVSGISVGKLEEITEFFRITTPRRHTLALNRYR